MQIIGILVAIVLLTALVLMVEVDENEQAELRERLLERAENVHRPPDWFTQQGETTSSMQD